MLLNAVKAAALVLPVASTVAASSMPRHIEDLVRKQVPADPSNVQTIKSPSGATIRYKEPGKEGICETTPGVNSYSGYVDMNNPDTAPITLWLNGGPGSDSLIGLFQVLNPYAWNEVSNMLFLSQPIGVGFSYDDEVIGVVDNSTGLPVNSSNPDGRYSDVDPYRTGTTQLAAVGTWEILQAFIENLPTLDATVKSRSFNLWTESYGGHYGPTFYRYFYEQNQAIQNGTAQGCALEMHTLGIINGIVSSRIQSPYYPEFAYKNTYGIQAVNESIYEYMKMNYYWPDRSTKRGQSVCAQATAVCRSLVESPYYYASGRNPYDIRAELDAEIPPEYFIEFLNLAKTQDALGVRVNYTSQSSTAVFYGFDLTGDFVYPDLLTDLETILDYGVRIAFIYGDAAVSLQVNYTNAEEFRASGYEPFVVDGVEYGASRQYGNFSFTRIYDAGHEVPYYQPKASLEYFRRILGDLVVADGTEKVTPTFGSEGPANATHTNTYTGYYTGQPGINDKRKF